MRDEEHGRFALQLIDRGEKVRSDSPIQTADRFVEVRELQFDFAIRKTAVDGKKTEMPQLSMLMELLCRCP